MITIMLTLLMSVSGLATNPEMLLEISTRPYLYSRGIKSIRELSAADLDSWQSKGFQWVWFMGVWQLGPLGLEHDRTDPGLRQGYSQVLPDWTNEDVIGSPYAIVTYDVNKDIGAWSDLEWLAGELHARQMKLMLDFVPNHSAQDAPEVLSKQNFYIRAEKGVSPDPRRFNTSTGIAFGCGMWCDPWTDVAQFNYMDKEFRQHQIDVLKKIAGVADGVRCDMSHLILRDAFWSYWEKELTSWGYSKIESEFWADAISAVKAEYPNFKFMAESYGDVLQTLHDCGFDYTYDKDLLDKLYAHDVAGFSWLLDQHNLEYKEKLAHFTENHDEPRAVGKFWNWPPAADSASAALLTLPGMRFFFQDQWEGPKNKLDVHLRRATAEAPDQTVVEFYNKLFPILRREALTKGTWTHLSCDGSSDILAWKWVHDDERILCAIHFGEGQAGGNIRLDDAPLSGSQIPVTDLMTGTTYYRDPEVLRTQGLTVVLGEYQVQIFQY